MKSIWPDYEVENHGTLFLFRPMNDSAKRNLTENIAIGEDAQWYAGGLVVEHRYAEGLALQLLDEGWVLA